MHSFHYEGYEIVCFSRDRILAGDNLTVFGSTVYTFNCLTCMHLSTPSITFSKSEIIRILKLKKIEPCNIVLFNHIDNRKLINFNEIANTVISRHPNLNWTLEYFNNGTSSEKINSWYLTKFIFGTHSSAIFGLYFMQPNSIAAVVEWMSCFSQFTTFGCFVWFIFRSHKRTKNDNCILWNWFATMRWFDWIRFEIWKYYLIVFLNFYFTGFTGAVLAVW